MANCVGVSASVVAQALIACYKNDCQLKEFALT